MIYALAAFVAATLVAVPWALYTKYVAERKAHRAALADAAIYLIGAVCLLGALESRWNVFFSAAGAYVGTRIALWRKPDEALT